MALALVASLVGVALSSSVSTAGWKPVVTTTDEERATVLPFTVALKPSNLAQLDALLEAVSVRSHPHDGDPSACHFVPSPTCHCPSTTTIHQVRALVVAQYVHVHAGAVANVPASGLLRLGFRDDTGHLKQALITVRTRFLHVHFSFSCHARAHAHTQDPDSPQYGQYLTSAEVIRLTATDPATVTRVRGALAPASCVDRGDSLRYALFSRPVHGNHGWGVIGPACSQSDHHQHHRTTPCAQAHSHRDSM
jgi:hypothetical protein